FIGDYIEMGRGNQYAVNFGEDCGTVSRPHAAIVRTEQGWVIKPLSAKNPTLLNRMPVQGQAPLNNGAEIQLSYEGPRLLFLIPANNSVASMGMTARMKAVVKEAVRPYKKTLTATLVVFLLIIGGLVYYMNGQQTNFKNMISKMEKVSKQERDSILSNNAAGQQRLENKIARLIKNQAPPQYNNTGGGYTGTTAASSVQSLYGNVYYIRTDKIVAEFNGQTFECPVGLSGTGFLLNDGSFVTARHCVEPWYFIKNESSEAMKAINVIASNGGKITHYFTAWSPSGGKISFKSTDFVIDRSQDEEGKYKEKDGTEVLVTLATKSLDNGRDWAVVKTDGKSGLSFNVDLSSKLPASTKLYVLGYPFGMGVNSAQDIKPIYSECQVSRDGLDNGKIDISGRGFDQGNSGGPVFAMVDNKYYVIGIVSAEYGAQGYIVPLASIH
ncbi:MAG: trypsin-like peptidase domain-containing protein, partial [Bacteroidetes bacterium]|nr:trypsin-like peptidase domain-containing protein [Bacteroidota bacterium]